jgi:formylglycine-generating enzyme
MSKNTSLSLTMGLSIAFFSFTFKAGIIIKAKEIQQDFVQVNDKLLIDKYEVSNDDYKIFLSHLKLGNQADLYNKCLLDTGMWSLNSSNEPMKTYYHSHKSYGNYPVVTVSYDAANEYCKWLTDQYHSDPNRKFKKVLFRLPTEQEWIYAAAGGDKNKMYPWDNYYLRNKKGEYLCNFLHLGDQAITYDPKTKSYKVIEGFIDKPTAPSPINSFYASPSGLFNLSGNAAEMVSERWLAKGGSYNDPGYDVRISSRKYYDLPSPEIGFRVAMEIVEK